LRCGGSRFGDKGEDIAVDIAVDIDVAVDDCGAVGNESSFGKARFNTEWTSFIDGR